MAEKPKPKRGPGQPKKLPSERVVSVNTSLPPAVAVWLATLDPRGRGSESAGLRAVAVAEYQRTAGAVR